MKWEMNQCNALHPHNHNVFQAGYVSRSGRFVFFLNLNSFMWEVNEGGGGIRAKYNLTIRRENMKQKEQGSPYLLAIFLN